jgi:hypothetical protein
MILSSILSICTLGLWFVLVLYGWVAWAASARKSCISNADLSFNNSHFLRIDATFFGQAIYAD